MKKTKDKVPSSTWAMMLRSNVVRAIIVTFFFAMGVAVVLVMSFDVYDHNGNHSNKPPSSSQSSSSSARSSRSRRVYSSGATARSRTGSIGTIPKFKNIKVATGTSLCEPEWIDQIQLQLPAPSDNDHIPGHCVHTSCPQRIWLERYYSEVIATNVTIQRTSFVGIVVGCGNGLDAVEALRMGSNSNWINKKRWIDHLLHQGISEEDMQIEECHNQRRRMPPLLVDFTNFFERSAVMHCIEPRRSNLLNLYAGAKALVKDNQSQAATLLISPYAISHQDEMIYIPIFADHSYKMCDDSIEGDRFGCQSMQAYSLNTYAKKYLFNDGSPHDSVHYIKINTVQPGGGRNLKELFKGGRELLRRTEYVEVVWDDEYDNDDHDASTPTLEDTVIVLDGQGFSCYWAGNEGQLYRLNGPKCYQNYYNTKCPPHQGNIACGNRFNAPSLVNIMEEIFMNSVKQHKVNEPDCSAMT